MKKLWAALLAGCWALAGQQAEETFLQANREVQEDFVLESGDQGKTWTPVAAPGNGTLYFFSAAKACRGATSRGICPGRGSALAWDLG